MNLNTQTPVFVPEATVRSRRYGVAGQTVLCLATQAWNEHWSLSQQVMMRACHDWNCKVIYVEPYHPPLAWLRRSNAKLRIDDGTAPLREVAENLLVYRPQYPYLPGNLKWRGASWTNGSLYRAEIKALLERVGWQRPWLWAFFAQNLSVLELPFSCFVYDCVDDWPSFFPDARERRYVEEVDEALCRRADLVFAGSAPLAEKKQSLNPRIYVVNHAADISHFTTACNQETIIPADLERIPHPRIGFVGMVDNVRFDATLIERIADNPAHHVVIIGGFMGDAEMRIAQRPNIHKLGMKKVTELPAYLKGLDVCTMPYRLNEATRNIFPLKLYEYMATGKPIVATPIPAVQGLEAVVYVAHDALEFQQMVGAALMESSYEMTARRLQHASGHTWEAHMEQKRQIILKQLLAA